MGQDLEGLIGTLGDIIDVAVPLMITVIVIFAIYAAIRFASAEEEGDRTKFRGQLVAAVIALAVVFSLFGLVRILQNTVFGGAINNTSTSQGLYAPVINQ